MEPAKNRLIHATYQFFSSHVFQAEDGKHLTVYEYGRPFAGTVVIVNPIGVPVVISSRLAHLLGERYRVICWEQRGYSDGLKSFLEAPHDYAAFLRDLISIVNRLTAHPLAIVGVCSGASLVVRALAQGLVDPSAAILISPAVRFKDGYTLSVFEQAVVPYMRMISKGNDELAQELLDMRKATPIHGSETPSLSEDEAIIDAADKVNLHSLESLSVYAKTVDIFSDQTFDEDLKQIKQQVLVFSATDDKTVSIRSVRKMTSMLPHAQLKEYAVGSHFLIFLHEQARLDIRAAIDSCLTQATQSLRA